MNLLILIAQVNDITQIRLDTPLTPDKGQQWWTFMLIPLGILLILSIAQLIFMMLKDGKKQIINEKLDIRNIRSEEIKNKRGKERKTIKH